MGVSVRPEGLAQLRRRVKETHERMSDLSPVTRVAAEELRSSIVRNAFGRSRGLNDEAWDPLKSREGTPLVDTGNLRQSVSTRGSDQAVLFGVTGSAANYGPAHQFGVPKRNLPRRPFLPLDQGGEPLLARGAARRWFKKYRQRITRYILEGKV